MKKTGIVLATIITFFLVGGLIIAWSVYQKEDLEKQLGQIRHFTDDNFNQEVVEASRSYPVVLDFYADWCFPCRLLDPVLKELAEDFRGRAVVGRVNTDQNLIARRFDIQRIPAVFIIRNAEIKKAFYGVVSKETLAKALKELES